MARRLLLAAAALAVCLPPAIAAVGPKEALLRLLPKDGAYAGWKRRGAPLFFDRDTLFEYIDGAANAFLDGGFRALAAVDLLPDGDGRSFVTVDVYDMKDAFRARRAFRKAACRSKPAGVGARSCTGPDHLYFHRGRYFVKLTASTDADPFPAAMLALAKKTAAGIPGK